MGHIKPRFLPTQKEEREPFHFVARHSDPVLKQVARETLDMPLNFQGCPGRAFPAGPRFMDGRRLRKGPMLT